jgi:eukaryotic-like serine/threonine-protein kinase
MHEPEVGDRLGPYVLEEELGRGSMGTVYRATRDDREVALKVMRPELASDQTFRQRFDREGRIAASLTHPHLVEVVDAGEIEGLPYLASRLVSGRSLAQRIEQAGPIPDAELVRILSEAATALDVIHERGLVHRDVKPANVMLDADGHAALADFGLARGAADTVLTTPGHVSGTVDYLAPELIRGEAATPATDVYALGCVAYECTSAAPPFAGKPVADAILAHLQEVPAVPASPLGHAIVQALAKAPADRPPTATAYALMLRVSLRQPLE